MVGVFVYGCMAVCWRDAFSGATGKLKHILKIYPCYLTVYLPSPRSLPINWSGKLTTYPSFFIAPSAAPGIQNHIWFAGGPNASMKGLSGGLEDCRSAVWVLSLVPHIFGSTLHLGSHEHPSGKNQMLFNNGNKNGPAREKCSPLKKIQKVFFKKRNKTISLPVLVIR